MNWRITRFPILASTNDLALDWMRSGRVTAGDVLVAGEQTSGRGRPGRSWHSARGALLFTAMLPFRPDRAGWHALAAGAAVARAARGFGVPAGVKWPNDVVVDTRKLAGILVETCRPDLAAVGVGLNVCNPYPKDPALAGRTARLAEFVPDAAVDDVLERVLTALADCWELLSAPDLMPLRELWAELDTSEGRRLRWSEAGVTGTAEGVDQDGALRLRTDAGELITAHVGEVAFMDG